MKYRPPEPGFDHPIPLEESPGPLKDGSVGAALKKLALLALAGGAFAVAAPHLFSRVRERGWDAVETAYGANATSACDGVRAAVKDRVAQMPSILGTNPEAVAAIREMTSDLRGCLEDQGVTPEDSAKLSLRILDPGFMEPLILNYQVRVDSVVKTD